MPLGPDISGEDAAVELRVVAYALADDARRSS
jgi:hypothetical protein